MKIVDNVGEVSRSGEISEQTFNIKASAKAFDILSAKLYTDVVMAIVREISTNAYDAQVDAGTADKPFQVHLPNALDPTFSIRDFGTGLSDEAMKKVYCTYFESTRASSDEFAGCLGLGSKSPFAYSDQFTVTSYYGGKAAIYSAFKNEYGVPSLAHLAESPTTEPNGLEVKLSVKAQDFGKFANSAIYLYRFFKVRPEISGNAITFPVQEHFFTGKNFYVTKERNNSQVIVIMGQVPYKVDLDKINYAQKIYAPVFITMDIGSCSVPASREELHYDKKTIQAVTGTLESIYAEVVSNVTKALDNSLTTYLKYCEAAKWRNVIALSMQQTSIYTTVKDKYSAELFGCDRYSSYSHISQCNCIYTSYDEKFSFLINDVSDLSKYKNKLRHYLVNNPTIQNLILFKDIKDQAELEKHFGANLPKISTLPDPPPVVKQVSLIKRAKPVFVKKFRPNNGSNASYYWEESEKDNLSGYLVKRRRNMLVNDSGKAIHPKEIDSEFIRHGPVIYGVSEKCYKNTLARNPKLKPLFPELEKEIDKIKARITDYQIVKLCNYHPIQDIICRNIDLVKDISQETKDLHKTLAAQLDQKETSIIRDMATTRKVPNFYEIFLDKYPLLRHNSSNDMYAIKHYIELIEKK